MKLEEVREKLPKITVHGRFQPPLHINHWDYISQAFKIADKVIILIANPYLSEVSVGEAPHRNLPENNPFTYDQRVQIFTSFFGQMGISPDRFEFRPFEIVDESKWSQVLDPAIPNLINTYGPWSENKLKRFLDQGYQVVHSQLPKSVPVSGTDIRKAIFSSLSKPDKKSELLRLGYMPEAITGLFDIMS